MQIDSRALQFAMSQGWYFHDSGTDQIAVETCPFCQNTNHKFYLNVSGEEKDGLYDCKVCGERGNLWQLKNKLGVSMGNVVSVQEASHGKRQPAPLPNFDLLHRNLMENEEYADVLDYLIHERKFTVEVIQRMKLGADTKEHDGETFKWYIIPYFDAAGKPIFFKGRSVHATKKYFRAPAGREACLFNSTVIKPGMDELLMVEGEADTLALLSAGYENVVGVPGAKNEKVAWIEMLDRAAPKTIYLLYDNDKPGQDGARTMAARIGLGKVRNILLPEFLKVDGTPGKDVNEWLSAGHTLEELEQLKAEARQFPVDGVKGVVEVLDDLEEEIICKGLNPTWDTGWPSLNQLIGGFEPGDLIGILAEAKRGKAQPLWCKIQTPNGWTTMGSVKVGDAVQSIDGTPSFVTGVFDRGVMGVYKITLSDGRCTWCSEDHLWRVRAKRWCNWRVVSTKELAEHMKEQDYIYVPFTSGFGWESAPDLPIDPWLLGVLLGDGSITEGTPHVTKNDEELADMAEEPAAMIGCAVRRCEYRGVKGFSLPKIQRGQSNPLTEKLKELGLHGTNSYTKFIPDVYLHAPRSARLAMLQGLLDTDGTIAKKGSVQFNTSSPHLAEGVEFLARSLGGVAKITVSRKWYAYKGQKLRSAPAYRVALNLPDRSELFRLRRKAARVSFKKQPRLSVRSIEYAGAEPVRCISVSHPSSLYITDDFIVTHNTKMLMNWLDYEARIKGIPSYLCCNEMLPRRLVRQWVSYVTQTEDNPTDSKITVETVKLARDMALSMPADLLFGYTATNRKEDVFDNIRQVVRRYGVRIVGFDNLHLMSTRADHAAQELSVITKGFKRLAMELNIAIILIMQPHRIKDGQIINASNVGESSAPEKDVDMMICLHRKRVAGDLKESDLHQGIQTAENFEPQLYVRADLTRYAPGGLTSLYFDGARSTIREWQTSDEILPSGLSMAVEGISV